MANFVICAANLQLEKKIISMNKIQRERNPLYITDAKNCARLVVRESLSKILAGTYKIPSLEKMISVLESDYIHQFDEFMVRRRIIRSHLDWDEHQIETELESQKRNYENELNVNLRVAAFNTIKEIENLIESLNNSIKKWKIKNL